MNTQDRVLAALSSRSRQVFLLALGHRLGIASRDIFPEESATRWDQARACNELMIAIWSQLWATADATDDGYPDSEFLPSLLQKADSGDARKYLRVAIEGALRAVESASPSAQSNVDAE